MIASAEEFVRLRTSINPDDYGRAASESATDAVWLTLVRNYPEMRFWVAQNKSIPLMALTLLATDPDVQVRCMVAMKRKLNPELFQLLAADPDETVRHSIACNAMTPRETLRRLTADPAEFVAEAARARISRNPDLHR
jgi:hypothetical protein